MNETFGLGLTKQNYEQDEIMGSGHLACPGCGATIAMRLALKALGRKTAMVIPACCWAVIIGPFPYSNLDIPVTQTAFETAASCASGVKAAFDARGERDVQVVAWAGDGGTFDIGLQALSGAAERNEDIIYVCYDNEAYMNTGIQRSSATPTGAWTTTTPTEYPKQVPKKNIVEIMAAHRIPYIATASVAFPHDLMNKFKKAKEIRGMRFIHIYSPCTAGWKMSSDMSIEVARLATLSNMFPLFEVFDGERYVLNYEVKDPVPVSEYLKTQYRFKHLTKEEIEKIQKETDKNYKNLLLKVKLSNELE